jgi:hypothetical protein
MNKAENPCAPSCDRSREPILAVLRDHFMDRRKVLEYGGRFTSESNASFDAWLKERGAHRGIRDVEAVDALARGIGLRLIEDRAMPSNNRCLIWWRVG